MSLWAINSLNCFNSHTINIYIHKSGQLAFGSSIAPDGSRCPHVWVERSGSLIDLFGWSDHIRQGYHFYPPHDQVLEILSWLSDNLIPLEDYM